MDLTIMICSFMKMNRNIYSYNVLIFLIFIHISINNYCNIFIFLNYFKHISIGILTFIYDSIILTDSIYICIYY